MTRAFRRWLCRVMVGVLVFAQASIAAYACPGMSGSAQDVSTTVPAAESAVAAPCAQAMPVVTESAVTSSAPDQMDPSSQALCAAHCDYGNQSADHSSAPTVQGALFTTLYILPGLSLPIGCAQPLFDQPRPQAASSPPLAILHCCFRI